MSGNKLQNRQVLSRLRMHITQCRWYAPWFSSETLALYKSLTYL